jgi:DNA-binding NtrC family response regulator
VAAYPTAKDALEQSKGRDIAVAVITSDDKDVPSEVATIHQRLPDVQVLLATNIGLPKALVSALVAGVTGVLEFRTQAPQEIVQTIQQALARNDRQRREGELLQRLHGLNEEFLKTIVATEKRNIELEQRMLAEADWGLAIQEGPQRVLIVDDEEVVRSVLEALLTKAGLPFESVETAESALEALEKSAFHLVITDKNLPGMSGVELMREAKRRSPQVEVILMTGYSSMESAIDAIDAGAAAYLQKPFEHIQTVRDRINGVLEKQKEEQRKKHYLHLIKDRNRSFLEQYRAIRADLEQWMATRGK